MSDLETLLREARARQDAAPMPSPAPVRPAVIWPWAVLAGIFIVIFLAIHFFWPVPSRFALPICGHAVATSCQKPAAPSP